MRLVDTAANAKPSITQLADRYAATFLWAILALAAVVAVGWHFIDPARALPAAVAVLIVTCPCALSLAAPVALSSAIGNLARHGVLVVKGNAIETLARATHFVFDKTGTLTTGRMKVEEVVLLSDVAQEEVLALAALMERVAVHPVAQAIAMAGAPHAAKFGAGRVTETQEIPGRGVEALIDGQRVRLGSVDFVAELCGSLPAHTLPDKRAASSVAAMGGAEGWTALMFLGDGVRGGSHAMVDGLKAGGARVVMASGDTPGAASAAAQASGLPPKVEP
jgi:Cu2+-exporting ATPase